MRRHRVALDCDPGIDDALGLYALAGTAGVEVAGITTVFGNVPVRQATRNVFRLLALLGRSRAAVPVGAGAEQPLVGSRLPRRSVHGRDGLGDTEIPGASVPEHLPDGAALLAQLAGGASLDALVATGPLTNVARLFAGSPGALRGIGRVLVMGGLLADPGSRGAEFNLASDPAAARCVLASQASVWWVPWPIAASVTFGGEQLAQFDAAHRGSTLGRAIAAMLRSAIARRGSGGQVALPDVVAALLAIEPGWARWAAKRVRVEARGRTGRFSFEVGVPNAQVCMGLSAEAVASAAWVSWSRVATAG